MLNTVIKIAIPGKMEAQGAERRYVRESLSIFPQLTRNGSPQPKKFKVAYSMMAVAIRMDAFTITCVITLGKIS